MEEQKVEGQEGQGTVAVAPEATEEAKATETPKVAETDWQNAYKGLQRETQKLQDKLKSYEAMGASPQLLQDLKGELAVLRKEAQVTRKALVVLAKRGDISEEPTELDKTFADLDNEVNQEEAKTKRARADADAWDQWRKVTYAEIEDIAKDCGLDLEKPEMADTLRLFKADDLAGAVKAARKAGITYVKAQGETNQAKRLAKKAELLESETSGGGGSADVIPTDRGKFIEWLSKIPQKEYEEKYAARVNELRRQGKIN